MILQLLLEASERIIVLGLIGFTLNGTRGTALIRLESAWCSCHALTLCLCLLGGGAAASLLALVTAIVTGLAFVWTAIEEASIKSFPFTAITYQRYKSPNKGADMFRKIQLTLWEQQLTWHDQKKSSPKYQLLVHNSSSLSLTWWLSWWTTVSAHVLIDDLITTVVRHKQCCADYHNWHHPPSAIVFMFAVMWCHCWGVMSIGDCPIAFDRLVKLS